MLPTYRLYTNEFFRQFPQQSSRTGELQNRNFGLPVDPAWGLRPDAIEYFKYGFQQLRIVLTVLQKPVNKSSIPMRRNGAEVSYGLLRIGQSGPSAQSDREEHEAPRITTARGCQGASGGSLRSLPALQKRERYRVVHRRHMRARIVRARRSGQTASTASAR